MFLFLDKIAKRSMKKLDAKGSAQLYFLIVCCLWPSMMMTVEFASMLSTQHCFVEDAALLLIKAVLTFFLMTCQTEVRPLLIQRGDQGFFQLECLPKE
jgi:hypothetical protein